MSPPALLLLSGPASHMDQYSSMYQNKSCVIHSLVASFWSGSQVFSLNTSTFVGFLFFFLTNQVQMLGMQENPPGAGTNTFPTFPFFPT